MNTTATDVIVIGGGAAGLAAARALAQESAETTVVILEARDRLGGRIWSSDDNVAGAAVELGAAFVHGGNDSLWSLVRQAGLTVTDAPDRHWTLQHRRCIALPDIWKRLDRVLTAIGPDTRGDFAAWWRRHESSYAPIERLLVREHVTDFNAAPTDQMSAATLFQSAQAPTPKQFQLPGGLAGLISALRDDLPAARVTVRVNDPVERVIWKPGHVDVTTRDGRRFEARAVLVTVPLGVLQARGPTPGVIRFSPELGGHAALWGQLHFGHALRVVLQLQPDAWEQHLFPAELRGDGGRAFGFLHADRGAFPVWWSQAPAPLLTGWVGGPAAWSLAQRPNQEIFRLALYSLAALLHCGEAELAEIIVAWHLHNWTADPYARGAYSFSQAGREDAPQRLAQSVRDTIFFAGEATADAAEVGTVHGALASGERAAREIQHALTGDSVATRRRREPAASR